MCVGLDRWVCSVFIDVSSIQGRHVVCVCRTRQMGVFCVCRCVKLTGKVCMLCVLMLDACVLCL